MDTQPMIEKMRADGTFKHLKGGTGDAEDVLSQFDRDIVGSAVRLNIHLKDPVIVRRHMKMLINIAEQIIMDIDQGGRKDRTILFAVKGRLRYLSARLDNKRNRNGT